mgnify:CR=1 FL=1
MISLPHWRTRINQLDKANASHSKNNRNSSKPPPLHIRACKQSWARHMERFLLELKTQGAASMSLIDLEKHLKNIIRE